ncbi:uncharacterized protein LOC141589907 [Silene latifolia]|uniref:uncharacterized protein LOC141589907 n=1 Tax=Silene latifolia TaxID=37657 RepID=UPI003D76B91D
MSRRRRRGQPTYPLDREIEATARRLNSLRRRGLLDTPPIEEGNHQEATEVFENPFGVLEQEPNTMGDPVPIRETMAPKHIVNPSIQRPRIQANNFEIKNVLLNLVQDNQFGGSPLENPNDHLNEFLENCDMYKSNGVSDDAVRLRLFLRSLRGSAKDWLKNCDSDSFKTWDELVSAFLNKYFPPSRTAKVKSELQSFTQEEDETLYEAWERYKRLQRLCPHHGISEAELVNNFYKGLTQDLRLSYAGSEKGALDILGHKAAKELIEEMASRTMEWGSDRQLRKGKNKDSNAVLNVEVKGMLDELTQQVALLNSKSSSSDMRQVLSCELCGEQGHTPIGCPLIAPLQEVCYEQANGVWESTSARQGFNNTNNQFGNGKITHPLLSYASQNIQNPTTSSPQQQRFNQNSQFQRQIPPGFQGKQFVTQNQQPFGGFKGQNFNQPQNQNFQTPQKPSWEQAFEQLVIANQKVNSKLDNHIASQSRVNDEIRTSQKSTETHVAQISQQLSQLAQNPGKFPGNTVNPREMNAVFLRSGRQLVEVEKSPKWKRKRVSSEVMKEHPVEVVEEGEIEVEKSTEVEMVGPPKQDEPIPTKAKDSTPPLREYVEPIPFPQRLARPRLEKKYEKFIEILKGMNVTIPFLDMMTEIPNYGKFLKELVTMKRKSEGVRSVNLSRECSAILTSKLPSKLEDPGSFSIPCSIQGVKIKRALCDLGASVSLMPLSLFKKLQFEDLKPSRISLQLADRSVKYPLGVIEDVPLMVGKLVIPCDFYVMDMSEDNNVPIILGRPYLATGGAMIDVKSGKLSLQVGEDKVEFELAKSMEAPSLSNSCCRVYMVEDNLDEPNLGPSFLDPLEACPKNEKGKEELKLECGGDHPNVIPPKFDSSTNTP